MDALEMNMAETKSEEQVFQERIEAGGENLQKAIQRIDEEDKLVERAQETRAEAQELADKINEPIPEWQSMTGNKFKSQEDLAKAYVELQKKLGQRSQEKETTPEEPAPITEEPKPAEAEVKQAEETIKDLESNPEISNILKEYNDLYNKAGDLTGEQIKELAGKVGIPENLISSYVEMAKVRDQAVVREAYDKFGGQEQYNAAMSWATDNLSDSEYRAVDDLLKSGDKMKVDFALDRIKNKYQSQASVVNDAGRVKASSSAAIADIDVFHSMMEVSKAMRDPRYNTDGPYTRKVHQNIEKAHKLGYLNN